MRSPIQLIVFIFSSIWLINVNADSSNFLQTINSKAIETGTFKRVGFSGDDIHRMAVGDSVLQVTIVEPVSKEEEKKLIKWIEFNADALRMAYGQLPLKKFNVLVFPIGPSRGVVPWGEVRRERGTSVHVHVDQTRSLQTMINDWTLYHEMSHTMHPYIHREGRWLSEGLASYYQNIIQARAKTLTKERAWTKLHQGFGRGYRQARRGENLEDVSINMHRNGKYMRVYWSGAAMWLRADWLLRSRHNSSLDEVMAGLQACCLPSNRTWRAHRFMRQLDKISGTKIFSDMYRTYSQSDKFPDMNEVYDSLGLIPNGKRLNFNDKAPNAHLINEIMRGK